MIIRPVAKNDLAELKAIASESGPGFTSLVNDHDFLLQKIERSVSSFADATGHDAAGSYLFVLVDPETGNIMGTTGIEASVGTRRPLYHYRVGHAIRQSPDLGLSCHQQTLTLSNHYAGCSEICTLYLRPQYRRAWAGKLLSRVRFLFMAQHPQRFASTVIAEMRGVSDEAGNSPLWRWLQANFVDLDFATVNRMVGTGDNGFIAELMPEHPLYIHLMDRSARSVIGKVHPKTRPALHMLESEGFRYTGFVDPFDGGPTVEAQLQDLKSVKRSTHCRLQVRASVSPSINEWTNRGEPKTLMVANNRTEDFRATVTNSAIYFADRQTLEMPETLAHSLGLEDGADVWCASLESGRTENLKPALSRANAQPRPAKEPLRAY